ncbi:MAG: leucine-rich repeat domain-containing protein [Muribaculaceae bacterium]|nr:leucine-rich repeat domain-containing protein [Muribaculaceae bacterium]
MPDGTSIIIKDGTTEITSSCFSMCFRLKSITIPNSVTTIGDWAFECCSDLTSIAIPNSVTYIGSGAFSGCSGLTSVTIPNSVTTIGLYAFLDCSKLESISIPNSVTFIGDHAFQNCTNLTSATIGTVDVIGSEAFSSCESLRTIHVKAENPPKISHSTFDVNHWYFSTLYVPIGCVDKYRYTEGWSGFSNILEEQSGVDDVVNDKMPADEVERFTIDGRKISSPIKGINVIRYSDGSTHKVLVK